MSYFSDQIESRADRILTSYIDVRSGTSKVPDVEDISLEKNQGVLIEAAYVYCDMANSTGMAQRIKKPVAAKILRSYLNCTTDILRHYDGAIRGFDGDRVLAIFIGTNRETRAVRAALAVNWLVAQSLGDKIHQQWTDLKEQNIWSLGHTIGVDTGEALMTRTGLRGDNDLVSVGSAPNAAAKLCDLDLYGKPPLRITEAVYAEMSNDVAFADDGRRMWSTPTRKTIGVKSFNVLTSAWWWEP